MDFFSDLGDLSSLLDLPEAHLQIVLIARDDLTVRNISTVFGQR